MVKFSNVTVNVVSQCMPAQLLCDCPYSTILINIHIHTLVNVRIPLKIETSLDNTDRNKFIRHPY